MDDDDEDIGYDYDQVESFVYIAQHVDEDRKAVEEGMRFLRQEDWRFAEACLEYFHPTSTERGTTMSLAVAMALLPEKQWRQGASSHQLCIWPENPDSDQRLEESYWGSDVTPVAECKHGHYTWFCIMAYNHIKQAKWLHTSG